MFKDLIIANSIRHKLIDLPWLPDQTRSLLSAGGMVTRQDVAELNYPPAWDEYMEQAGDAIPGTFAAVNEKMKELAKNV